MKKGGGEEGALKVIEISTDEREREREREKVRGGQSAIQYPD